MFSKMWLREGRRAQRKHRDYISILAWETFGIPKNQQDSVIGKRDVWVSILGLLLTRPDY